MKNLSYIVLFAIGIIIISATAFFKPLTTSKVLKNNMQLITTQKEFIAGHPIELLFTKIDTANNVHLVINHSYGSSVIQGQLHKQQIIFKIPEIYSKKTGILSWVLVENKTPILKNSINIRPNKASKTHIESYLGPKSILAGNTDYTMYVVIPTDNFDNPLPDSTEVQIREQFLNNIDLFKVKTNHLIAWKNHFAKQKAGILTVASSCNNTNSGEFNSVIYPSNPVNFTINYQQNHAFADGNQLTQLTTSVLKDAYNNTVSDGTLVDFIISTQNKQLKTSASTINGIATAKILHPDAPSTWKIKAYVTGLASSNSIYVDFKSIINDFNVAFSEQNRQIIVGPLHSFMNQIIPDGAVVQLHIYNSKGFVETKTETSFEGFVSFYLSKEFYKEPSYYFIVETLGISKRIPQKNYAN
jgi:hypothetical protein